MATALGCRANARISSICSGTKSPQFSGWMPTAAYTWGYRSASSTAMREDSTVQPGLTMSPTFFSGMADSTASRSASKASSS